MSQSRCGEKLREESNEMFFVQLKEPTEVRRNILETLKDIVELLQRFEKYKHLRHQKLEKIQQLRVLVKSTNKLVGDLRVRLPQTNLKPQVTKGPSKERKENSAKKKKGKQAEEKIPKKGMTELERLQSELSSIEGKLKNLT